MLSNGFHRYGNQEVHINEDQLWANPALSSQFAIIADETGVYNDSPDTYSLSWGQEELDYIVNWVKTRGGNGFSGFVHRF